MREKVQKDIQDVRKLARQLIEKGDHQSGNDWKKDEALIEIHRQMGEALQRALEDRQQAIDSNIKSKRAGGIQSGIKRSSKEDAKLRRVVNALKKQNFQMPAPGGHWMKRALKALEQSKVISVRSITDRWLKDHADLLRARLAKRTSK